MATAALKRKGELVRQLTAFCRIIDTISDKTGKGVSFLILFLALALVYEVVARYVFNRPTQWAHEFGMFMFGTACMLVGAYVLLHKAHVNLDILYARVTRRKQAILDLITAPVFFFVMVLIIWHSTDFALNSWKMLEISSSPWHPPYYPIKTIIPIAALLLLLQGVVKFTRDLFFVIHGRELE